MTPLQQIQFLDKYARWRPDAARRETWPEACDRVVSWMRDQQPVSLTGETVWTELRSAMLAMDVLPSMRVLQMAGPALDRCHVAAYNCSYLPLDSWQSFGELLYILMQGTGAGFSVEDRYVAQLPKIRPFVEPLVGGPLVVPDTTEGWCRTLVHTLTVVAQGYSVEWDLSRIRPQGARLATKGGWASGPEPLLHLLEFVCKVIERRREAGYLRPIDAHDIACYCGQIVQVGGVRRAAEISLSDLDDHELRTAKSGAFWHAAPWRAMANNSAVYEGRPGLAEFLGEWVELAGSGSGERGIFNRAAARAQAARHDRTDSRFGTNPCGEIILRPAQFCNLSIAVARPHDTVESLAGKVELATIWGTLQSQLVNFTYLHQGWRENCAQERLLGVDITGQMDCPLLFPWTGGRAATLTYLRTVATEINRIWAARLEIPRSAAITTVKPSGNSGVLTGASSGLHPRYAPFYLRRLRMGSYTPIAQWLKDAGVPWHPEVGQTAQQHSVAVFEFPVASPPGALTRHDLSVTQQLENWREWRQHYTHHNPSVTIYVRDEHEWMQAGAWVFEHFDEVGGLSFLPQDGGVYELAPYEELSQEEYARRMVNPPCLDFALLQHYEQEDQTSFSDFECAGGVCEAR